MHCFKCFLPIFFTVFICKWNLSVHVFYIESYTFYLLTELQNQYKLLSRWSKAEFIRPFSAVKKRFYKIDKNLYIDSCTVCPFWNSSKIFSATIYWSFIRFYFGFLKNFKAEICAKDLQTLAIRTWLFLLYTLFFRSMLYLINRIQFV